MDALTERKWDRVARGYDRGARAAEQRWAPAKRALFSLMHGKVLFVAVGTGRDIEFFPPAQEVIAVDISARMLETAAPRAAAYDGTIELRHADVHELSDPDDTFDQVFTSCTFCSVPRPVDGLRSLRRVLKPGGELHMFEHTGSGYFPFSLMLTAMTPLVRRFGPELDRDTVRNVARAGFTLTGIEPVYLDVVKAIHAVAPGARPNAGQAAKWPGHPCIARDTDSQHRRHR